MQTIKNFYGDWINLLREIMVEYWKYDEAEVNSISDDDIPHYYYNAELRRLEATPRKVHISKSFHCPVEHQAGWNLLKSKIENGENLIPHLSKLVSTLEKSDPMLNDWKVHHFHLGTVMEGAYIKRTGPLVFAYVTDSDVYVTNIFEHGQWENKDVIEIIHSNWPLAIENCKLLGNQGMAYEPTAQERRSLRKNQVNSFVTVSDGTVYAPLGGGSSSSGFNVNSSLLIIRQKKLFDNLEKTIDDNISDIIPQLKSSGYDEKSDIKVKLVIEGKGYYALFEEFNSVIQFSI